MSLPGCYLPDALAAAVTDSLRAMATDNVVTRIWRGDASVWTGRDEQAWLGWLEIVAASAGSLDELVAFADQVRADGFTHVLLLGMGGSSMAPEVMQLTFGAVAGYPRLLVLDSTDPAQIAAVESALPLASTLFVVSSKSGSSLEPNILRDYFYQRVLDTAGATQAARQFVAITDPGSSLDIQAQQQGYRAIFHGVPEIGGRFSALSNFGVLPAVLAGVDCRQLLQRAAVMVEACHVEREPVDNPGLLLGAVLGEAAHQGRDKLTLVISPELAGLGAWIEQLVAESTGKQGRGIIPVDGELPGAPEEYGDDRLFVFVHLAGSADSDQALAVARLRTAGLPVVTIDVESPLDIGQEFFRWEMATAVAGAILSLNPFDQPDVESSKVESRRITAVCESGGTLPEQTVLAGDAGLTLFTDEVNAGVLRELCGESAGVAEFLRAHIRRLGGGDYFAVLAYLARDAEHAAGLQTLRHLVRDRHGVATCVGFGPRFLHSTGQVYKGGPNTGVFLQLMAEATDDIRVPGRYCTFGVVEAAQAYGDFAVLASRKRRILGVHLGRDVAAGLARLVTLLQSGDD